MSFYFHSGTRRVSLLFGVAAFLAVWAALALCGFPKALYAALLLGLCVTLTVSLTLPLRAWLRYRGIERSLPKPVLLKTDVGIGGEDTLRGGYLYLTEDTLYLFARDRKPYSTQTLSKELVRSAVVEQSVYMTLHLTNAARCILTCGQCDRLLALMREHGWGVD